MNKYLYFFLKIGLLLLIVGILDYLVGQTLNAYYFKQKSGKLYRTTVSMEQTTAEALILGSSRANHHYYPPLIQSALNHTVYNAGRDGEYIFYHYAVLKAALKRYKPKLVILELQREEFLEDQASYDKLSSLLPYYATHPEIRAVVHLRSPYERIKLLSRVYPYNSAALTILAGTGKFTKSKEVDFNGYVPLTNVWPHTLKPEVEKRIKKEVDTHKLDTYKSFINDCKKANVRVIVVCSPYFTKFKADDQSLQIAQKIARSSGVEFYDYSNDPFFLSRRELFSDIFHLNHQGAIQFNKRLLGKLNAGILFRTDSKNSIR